MKKARDLGRNDQANEFAESLLDDLKPYEYRNMPTEGFFLATIVKIVTDLNYRIAVVITE